MCIPFSDSPGDSVANFPILVFPPCVLHLGNRDCQVSTASQSCRCFGPVDADCRVTGQFIRAFWWPDGDFHVIVGGFDARYHRAFADFPSAVFELFPCIRANDAVVSEDSHIAKASPSPSLESMPILTGIRPLSSDSDGTMPGKSLTMLVCIHDASGSCRHVLTRAANETSSEIAAIITDGVNHCPIDSSFLRLFFLGLVCAISSLRRGKEPFSTVRPMEVLQMIAYVVRCDTCGAEAFVPLNQDPDMAMSARGWRMRPHSKMCKDCVFAVEGPKIPPSMAEV